MTQTLTPQLLEDVQEATNTIDRADDNLADLQDRLRTRGDHARVAKLQTARNRLDDAKQIVESSFR